MAEAGREDLGGELILAALRGEREAARELIRAGADLGAADERAGGSALHWAAFWGQWRIARDLVEAGAPELARELLAREESARLGREAGEGGGRGRRGRRV